MTIYYVKYKTLIFSGRNPKVSNEVNEGKNLEWRTVVSVTGVRVKEDVVTAESMCEYERC